MYVFKNFKNTTILFYSNDLDLESAISPASANFLTNNLSSTSLICNIFMIQFFSRNILSFLFFSVKPNSKLKQKVFHNLDALYSEIRIKSATSNACFSN